MLAELNEGVNIDKFLYAWRKKSEKKTRLAERIQKLKYSPPPLLILNQYSPKSPGAKSFFSHSSSEIHCVCEWVSEWVREHYSFQLIIPHFPSPPLDAKQRITSSEICGNNLPIHQPPNIISKQTSMINQWIHASNCPRSLGDQAEGKSNQFAHYILSRLRTN